jgi:hypothetical protein
MVEKPTAPRREVHVDLSGLSQTQLHLRGRVIALGERALGPRWQSGLAEELSRELGRPIAQSRVGHWVSGFRPVPEAWEPALRRIALRLADRMAKDIDAIRADWAEDPPAEDVHAIENA